mgnify:CR=1 FL=1
MLDILEVQNFDLVTDPVKTEEMIYNQLHKFKDSIKTDYTYVAFPLAFSINNNGLPYTQNIINNICAQNQNKKIFFVCQHILVNKLFFPNNSLVFTPHATILDSHIPIPHYACNYDLKYAKPWAERKYDYSFVGSFRTHPVRERVYDFLKNKKNCFILDTGGWHFESDIKKQEDNAQKYIEVLGNTRYSLCPRGTGPSTIRIWESMAMGSKPAILSDYLKMPLEMFLEKPLWCNIPESFESIDLECNIFENSEYWEHFSNDNLYKSISKILQ